MCASHQLSVNICIISIAHYQTSVNQKHRHQLVNCCYKIWHISHKSYKQLTPILKFTC